MNKIKSVPFSTFSEAARKENNSNLTETFNNAYRKTNNKIEYAQRNIKLKDIVVNITKISFLVFTFVGITATATGVISSLFSTPVNACDMGPLSRLLDEKPELLEKINQAVQTFTNSNCKVSLAEACRNNGISLSDIDNLNKASEALTETEKSFVLEYLDILKPVMNMIKETISK